jgi:hypothetical protein
VPLPHSSLLLYGVTTLFKGVANGWDPSRAYYSEECRKRCISSATGATNIINNTQSRADVDGSGSAGPFADGAEDLVLLPLPSSEACRTAPYILVGVPPLLFQQHLRYKWSNGTVSLEPPPPGTLDISFALEWDAVGGHGKTGPGGFQIDAADGGVAGAEPLQAGYYHAIILAQVSERGSSSEEGSDATATATPPAVLVIKRFGFRVEGQPPFRVLNYTRSAAPCQGVGQPDSVQQVEAVERCAKQTTHIDCYSGATVWIAAIQLTAVEHRAGKVKLAIEGAPAGCTVLVVLD